MFDLKFDPQGNIIINIIINIYIFFNFILCYFGLFIYINEFAKILKEIILNNLIRQVHYRSMYERDFVYTMRGSELEDK